MTFNCSDMNRSSFTAQCCESACACASSAADMIIMSIAAMAMLIVFHALTVSLRLCLIISILSLIIIVSILGVYILPSRRKA